MQVTPRTFCSGVRGYVTLRYFSKLVVLSPFMSVDVQFSVKSFLFNKCVAEGGPATWYLLFCSVPCARCSTVHHTFRLRYEEGD